MRLEILAEIASERANLRERSIARAGLTLSEQQAWGVHHIRRLDVKCLRNVDISHQATETLKLVTTQIPIKN